MTDTDLRTARSRKARVMLVLTGALVLLMGGVSVAANPAPVQLFYVPFPEDQLLQGLQSINATAANPVTTYISIAAVADGTIIYYDQWENGYDADIANPLNLYNGGNPGGTQIWGDGDPSNGAPPFVCVGGSNAGAACTVPSQCPSGTCDTSDLVDAGKVILLKNDVNTANLSAIDFDGRDKLAATKTVAVSHTAWGAGSGTLLAGSVEVFDTNSWGTEFLAPIGADIADITDHQMFEYTSLAIMAGEGGATIQIDKDANGVFETTQPLNEGESYFVNGGVNVGARITSDNPVQVDILTGDANSTYESRDSALLPTDLWATDYYTPVSTTAGPVGSTNGTATTVWLYNPTASTISVGYTTRNGLGNLTTTTLSVPGGAHGGFLPQVIPDGYGAHFSTATTPFYAFSATNSTDTNTGGNQAWDWGYTLVPKDSLTPQLLIGLGIGRDPTSGLNLTENGNPVWVTPISNGDIPVIVYVDFDADPGTGANVDPYGNQYDLALTLKELERAKVYDTGDRDQTGTLLYTCGSTVAAGPCDVVPDVKLAGAWGQDPLAATASAPGLDVGTGVPPLPLFSAGKNGTLLTDTDGDGFISPGDVLLYTISIVNISRVPVPDILLKDTLPADTTYVENSTFFTDAAMVTTQIPDDGGGTAFPLDGVGVVLDTITALPVGGSYQVTFQVTIDSFANLTPGTTQIVNVCSATAVGVTVPCEDNTPLNGCIGDFVWKDLDGDTMQDGGAETGIPVVTLKVYRDVNNNGVIDGDPLVGTDVTDGSGLYRINGLVADTYLVDVDDLTVPPGYVLTTANDPKVITLAGGQCDLTGDFGYLIPATPTPTATPTFTPSVAPTLLAATNATATLTPSSTPTPSATETPTSSPSPTATATETPVVTVTATITATATATATPTASATPVLTGTPTATPTPTGPCGNDQLDPGETCDPPGTLMPPNGNPCRTDCTYCGDMATQVQDGESCDDANSVSGCRPDRPQLALDECLNNCQFPICEDPSRIQLYPDHDDVVQVHGRLIAPTDVDFGTGDFVVRISRRICSQDTSVPCAADAECDALTPGSICTPEPIFEQAVAGSAIEGNGKRWKYRNPSAKTEGGLYQLKITGKTSRKVCAGSSNAGARCATAADCPQGSCLGYYALKLKGYGGADKAVSDMQTQIYGGGYGWAVRGIWQQFPKGWRLYKKSVLLDPYL